MEYYVLIIWGDVEPQLGGPFGTEEERDANATAIRSLNGDEHGIFKLDKDGHELSVDSYSGGFFEE